MNKQDKEYSDKRENIQTKIKKMKKEKVNLEIREAESHLMKFKGALKNLELLRENSRKRHSSIDNKRISLQNELIETEKDIASIKKERKLLQASVKKVLSSIKKEESKINQLKEKLISKI